MKGLFKRLGQEFFYPSATIWDSDLYPFSIYAIITFFYTFFLLFQHSLKVKMSSVQPN